MIVSNLCSEHSLSLSKVIPSVKPTRKDVPSLPCAFAPRGLCTCFSSGPIHPRLSYPLPPTPAHLLTSPLEKQKHHWILNSEGALLGTGLEGVGRTVDWFTNKHENNAPPRCRLFCACSVRSLTCQSRHTLLLLVSFRYSLGNDFVGKCYLKTL